MFCAYVTLNPVNGNFMIPLTDIIISMDLTANVDLKWRPTEKAWICELKQNSSGVDKAIEMTKTLTVRCNELTELANDFPICCNSILSAITTSNHVADMQMRIDSWFTYYVALIDEIYFLRKGFIVRQYHLIESKTYVCLSRFAGLCDIDSEKFVRSYCSVYGIESFINTFPKKNKVTYKYL